MLESLGYFLIVMVTLAGVVMALAALWAKSRFSDGKHGAEGELIKDGNRKQKEAEDAAEAERKRLEERLG